MHTDLKAQLLATVRKTCACHGMFRPGERVGVAVSGGADSVALLALLQELRAEMGLTLIVVHFQHGLRGEESAGDQQFVADLAKAQGLEFFAASEDVAAWAREHHHNLEDAARHLRYAYFARLVAQHSAERIAVGHTADDQAETVLAHLLRGTGLAGLGGIHPVAREVVRPLLDLRRAALREWLGSIGQDWREDSSNADLSRLRARLRSELLPRIEKDFQAEIVPRLASLSSLAREEESLWRALAEERFRAVVKESAHGLSLPIEGLLSPLPWLPDAPAEATRAMSRRLVRRIVEGVAGHRQGLTARHVEQVLRLARESTSGHRTELPHGIMVERCFDTLEFSLAPDSAAKLKTGNRASASYEYVLELSSRGPTQVTIPAIQRRVCLKVVDWPLPTGETRDSAEALDAELLHPPCLLRNWRPGDVYRPRGRRKQHKVKELFREVRIPVRERASWPVLACGGRVVWVRGLGVNEEFAARPGTRAGLLIFEETL
jgi:tRNA(Ile)-lysidine synthase